jgi:diaminopimelate epimerase
VVLTDAGPCAVELLRRGDAIVGARVNMGPPRRIERAVELSGDFGRVSATLIDMGNPHCVLWVEDERSARVSELGPLLERHTRFPERTNVEFAALRDGQWRLRVWERGVGETAACGTGACATAVAALLERRARSPVELRLPGGILTVEWADAGDVWLTGSSQLLGSWAIELEERVGR